MRHIAVILFLLLPLGVFAQSGRFVNYGASDGLPSNTVYALAQDGDGALWVGTRGGLSRFDGVRFQTVLAGKRITSIAVDGENRIWAGTPEGLFVEVPGSHRQSCLEGSNIRALLSDSEGFVWATAGDSLLVKLSYLPSEGIKEEARIFYDKRYNEGDYPYFQIFEDSEGVIWLGGRIVRTQFIQDKSNPISTLLFGPGGHCTGSYAEIDGALYAFNDFVNTLNIYEGTDIKELGRLPVAHATLLGDSHGRLWAAGFYGLGLVDIDHPEQTTVFKHIADDPSSVASSELYCIFEDSQGNIWVGGDNGLSVLCPAMQQVQTLNVPSKQITALMEASDGSLWVGTADDGAYRMRSQGKPDHIDYRPAGRPNEGHVSCLYEDSEGAIYIGLYAGCGFNIWKDGRVRRGAISGPIPAKQDPVAWEDRIHSNWITDFLEDRDGRFYVVSWEGVGINEWDRKTGKTAPAEWLSPFFYPLPHLDSTIYLSSRLGSRLIEDSKGNLVYGTTEAGLNVIDKDTRLVAKYLPSPSDSLSLPDNYVTDLCLRPDGTLWVATRGGLWTPGGEGRRVLLRGKMVQSVRSDAKGRLWAGTEEGLYFIDTDGSIGVAHTGLGFPSDIYGEHAACTLSDGRMAFGGPSGAAVFHPDSLLAIRESLPLSSLVQHRYRLKGGEWTYGRFSGLPDHMMPGLYTLEEQSSDIFGRWEKGTSGTSRIRVPMPLLLRWPFIILYILLLLAVIWMIIRLRERKVLLQELDTRNRFFSIISHDLRNPISGNKLLIRQLLERADTLSPEQIKEGLKALSVSAENTSTLLENLLLWSLDQKEMLVPVMREENLAALAAEAVDSVHANGTVQVDIPSGATVITDRNMLLTCLRNLLDNAVKVTPKGGKVVISTRGRQIIITDEGPGLKEGAPGWGHGPGLVITRELLEKMGAFMDERNRPEGGLEITITL